MAGNLGVSLSESYTRFYTKVEANVWHNPLISAFKKCEVTQSQVLEAIKNALHRTKSFNEIIIGLILSFHGYRVIPLPYKVNAKERFLLRKEAREKWVGNCDSS